MSVFLPRRGKPSDFNSTVGTNYLVGSSVYLHVDGTLREFIIVHVGNPSRDMYQNGNGIWLLMKDIYSTRVMDYDSNLYDISDIHSYLNNEFFSVLGDLEKSHIKQVKIPYCKDDGDTLVNTMGLGYGDSGLPAKVFLLSRIEVGSYDIKSNDSYKDVKDGVILDYFIGTTNTGKDDKRISYINSTATYWWLRTPDGISSTNYDSWCISTMGSPYSDNVSTKNYGIRPALVLPNNAQFDSTTREFIGVSL